MKLPIKKKYFDEIKNENKIYEFRDAHLTLVCEETGEELRREVLAAKVCRRPASLFPDVLEDDWMIVFTLDFE